MQREWLELVSREGTVDAQAPGLPVGLGSDADGELPCPACGTAAPLIAGACSDCGLQLE